MQILGDSVHGLALALLLAAALAAPAADREVGPGRAYARIEDAYAAASAGDTILVYPQANAAAYERVALYVTKSDLTFRGQTTNGTRVALAGAGYHYTGVGSTPRAMFQFNPGADGCTVENFEISGCTNDSYNGAAVRINQANDTTVRKCHVHHNDMGFMSGGDHASGTGTNQLIENCLVHDNGNWGHAGFNHNFYMGGASVILRGCNVHSATTGHNVKSRAHLTILEGCYIHDSSNREFDLVDSSVNTAIPDSHALVRGCVIVKDPACSGNKTTIHFGQDGSADHNGTLHLIDTTIVTPFASPVVDLSSTNAAVRFENCIVTHPSGSAGGQTLVSATRNGASDANSNGSHLWLSAGFAVPPAGTFSNVTTGTAGTYPPFADPPNGDYRLGAHFAGAVDAGAAVPESSLPGSLRGRTILEFTEPLGSAARSNQGAPDIGAHEYGVPGPGPACPTGLSVGR